MEKGKRYDVGPNSAGQTGKIVEHPDGSWLFDPDKDTEEKVAFLENQVTDLANFLEEKKTQIASLEEAANDL